MNKQDYTKAKETAVKPDVSKMHKESDAMVEELRDREADKGTELQVLVDEGRDVKLPLRVLYEQKKLDYGKSPLWFLQALGSMSLEELREFLTENEGALTANEIAASDLILGVVKKDSVSVERFWRLQEKMLSNKSIQQQVNNIVISSDSAIKSQLDAISSNLFGTGTNKAD